MKKLNAREREAREAEYRARLRRRIIESDKVLFSAAVANSLFPHQEQSKEPEWGA